MAQNVQVTPVQKRAGMGEKMIGMAAPIVGGMIAGPIGAMAGSAIGGQISGEGGMDLSPAVGMATGGLTGGGSPAAPAAAAPAMAPAAVSGMPGNPVDRRMQILKDQESMTNALAQVQQNPELNKKFGPALSTGLKNSQSYGA